MKKYFLSLVIILAPFFLHAQYLEVGLGIGGSVYYGDLTPDQFQSNFKLVRPALGLYGTHHLSEKLGVRLGISNFTLMADDALNNREILKNRNLSFQSKVWEVEISGQYHLIGYEPEYLTKRFGMYIRSGVVLFYHNPKAYFGGQYYALQPLGTEGQGTESFPDRKPYSRLQIGIPVIGGLKFACTSTINVFIEFGPRFTFTDYLDDVSKTYGIEQEMRALNGDISIDLSDRRILDNGVAKEYPSRGQRGNAKSKDLYFLGLAGVSINLDDIIGNQFGGRVKCPKF